MYDCVLVALMVVAIATPGKRVRSSSEIKCYVCIDIYMTGVWFCKMINIIWNYVCACVAACVRGCMFCFVLYIVSINLFKKNLQLESFTKVYLFKSSISSAIALTENVQKRFCEQNFLDVYICNYWVRSVCYTYDCPIFLYKIFNCISFYHLNMYHWSFHI